MKDLFPVTLILKLLEEKLKKKLLIYPAILALDFGLRTHLLPLLFVNIISIGCIKYQS